MLILEGADNLGKTTAAKRLVELAKVSGEFPVRYQHMTRPDEATFNFKSHYLDMISMYAVQDRFHLGGIVYHDNKLQEPALRWLEGNLLAHGSLCVIFVCNDLTWYEKHLRTEVKEEMFTIEKMINVNKFYLRMVRENSVWMDDVMYVEEGNFPTDEILKGWLDRWYARLRFLRDDV